jgi:hypothetical protein
MGMKSASDVQSMSSFGSRSAMILFNSRSSIGSLGFPYAHNKEETYMAPDETTTDEELRISSM